MHVVFELAYQICNKHVSPSVKTPNLNLAICSERLCKSDDVTRRLSNMKSSRLPLLAAVLDARLEEYRNGLL
jgi:hypothetical protein